MSAMGNNRRGLRAVFMFARYAPVSKCTGRPAAAAFLAVGGGPSRARDMSAACPLYPQKQTFAAPNGMFAKGH
jgi:hypothetical protein